MVPHFAGREVAFLGFLASEFAKGNVQHTFDRNDFHLDGAIVGVGEFESLIQTMEGCGVVSILSRGSDGSCFVSITHVAVQLMREIQFMSEIEKRDAERREADRRARLEDKEADRRWQLEQQRNDRLWRLGLAMLAAIFSLITLFVGHWLGRSH